VLYPQKLVEILKYHPQYRMMSNVGQIQSHLRRNDIVIYNPDFIRGELRLLQHVRQWISNPLPEDFLVIALKHLKFDAPPLVDPPDPDTVL
jgi:hypothetical protein